MNIAGQLEQSLQHVVTSGQPAAQPAIRTEPTNELPPDEYVRGADLSRMAPKLIDDRVDSRMEGVNEQFAAIALNAVRTEYPDEFQQYGPEIYGQLSRLNKKAGAWSLDNLRTVVRMVRADHVDEIVRAKLNAQSPQEPALRSTGAAPVSVTPAATDFSVKSEQLPADYRERLAKANITDATMQEFCRANNMTVEAFFKMVTRGHTITEAPVRA